MELQEGIGGFLIAKKQEGLSPHSRELYRYVLNEFTERVGIAQPLSDISTDCIRQHILYLQERKTPRGTLSAASIDIHFRHLKAFFRWLVDEECLPVNPMQRVKRPRVPKPLPTVLTEAQINHLLTNVRKDGDRQSYRDYCIIATFLGTGVRLNELAALTIDDVNLDGGYAKVFGKGSKERIVPFLDPSLVSDLWRYLHRHRKPRFAGDTAFFLNEHNVGLQRDGFKMLVRRAMHDYMGDQIAKHGAHVFRHTFATMYIKYKCGDLERLRKIMGHTDLKTLQVYMHLAGTDVISNDGSSALLDKIRRAK